MEFTIMKTKPGHGFTLIELLRHLGGRYNTHTGYRSAGSAAWRPGDRIMKRYRPAFTLIELLTVVAIITLLMALLLPALNRARRQSKDTNAKAHLHAIETGLEMFQNERGQYPSSDKDDENFSNLKGRPEYAYIDDRVKQMMSGMHTLANALVGQDMLGFDPKGLYKEETAKDRVGPLVKVGTSGAAQDDDTSRTKLYPPPWDLENLPGAVVLLDPSYGLPILYYKASRTGRASIEMSDLPGYYFFDHNKVVTGDKNDPLCPGWKFDPTGEMHKISDIDWFRRYITNPKVGNPDDQDYVPKPYNMDTFLLISPGYDRLYGTLDDIHNWTVPD